MPREPRFREAVSFSKTEHETVNAAADATGRFRAQFIRETSVQAARRELAKRAKKGGEE